MNIADGARRRFDTNTLSHSVAAGECSWRGSGMMARHQRELSSVAVGDAALLTLPCRASRSRLTTLCSYLDARTRPMNNKKGEECDCGLSPG